jgi:hypothetical protein
LAEETTAAGHDPKALREKLDQFRREKEKIRDIVGQIRGVGRPRREGRR